jgi:hypothetical protein
LDNGLVFFAFLQIGGDYVSIEFSVKISSYIFSEFLNNVHDPTTNKLIVIIRSRRRSVLINKRLRDLFLEWFCLIDRNLTKWYFFFHDFTKICLERNKKFSFLLLYKAGTRCELVENVCHLCLESFKWCLKVFNYLLEKVKIYFITFLFSKIILFKLNLSRIASSIKPSVLSISAYVIRESN